MTTFTAKAIEVPTLAEIAGLYRSAVEQKNDTLKTTAEAAVKHLAVAEAAAAEAATLTSFAEFVRR